MRFDSQGRRPRTFVPFRRADRPARGAASERALFGVQPSRGARVLSSLFGNTRTPSIATQADEAAGLDAITVIIPTRDESMHIARCIDSARPLGRVVVVDCGSTDGTQRIAREHGAEVIEHAWPGHAAQKNWALAHAGITTPWVLFLDADEYLPPATVASISVATHTGAAGYYLARSYIFLGRPLRHAWWYPDAQLRLFRHGRGRFEERRVHEHALVDGAVDTLDADIMHENLKGLSAFVDRHNRYSDLEAEEWAQPVRLSRRGSWIGAWAERRRALKRVWFRLPGRPILRFLYLYLFRRGFLDGRRGLLFCTLIAMYDAMIEAKIVERKLASAGARALGNNVAQFPAVVPTGVARPASAASRSHVSNPSPAEEPELRDAA